MKVFFDYQIYISQTIGGISRYHSMIAEQINIGTVDKVLIDVLGSDNKYLEERQSRFRFFNRIRPLSLLSIVNKCYTLLKFKSFDVFHPTYYDPYFLEFKNKVPYVLTIHDMIPENLYPVKLKWLINNKRKLIDNANAIIAISHATKDEFLKHFPNYNTENIYVIHHGGPSPVSDIVQNVSTIVLPQRYILFVGLREHYKNFIFFIESVGGYLKDNELDVLVIGKEFTDHEYACLSRLGLKDRIKLVSNISDADLWLAYRNAICFVYPSIAEGFGLPLLEAFQANCPVVCTNISVFREVAEDAALYFDVGDSAGLVESIDVLCRNAQARENIIKAGRTQLLKYDWKVSALKTLEVYRKVYGDSKIK